LELLKTESLNNISCVTALTDIYIQQTNNGSMRCAKPHACVWKTRADVVQTQQLFTLYLLFPMNSEWYTEYIYPLTD